MKYYRAMIQYNGVKYRGGIACNNLDTNDICFSLKQKIGNMELTDMEADVSVTEITEKEYRNMMPLKKVLKVIRHIDTDIKVAQCRDRSKIYGCSPIYTFFLTAVIRIFN